MNKNAIKLFFLLFLILSVLWIGLTIKHLANEKKYVIENAINENLVIDESTSALIEKYMEEIIGNLNVIKDSNEVASFVNNPSSENLEQVNDMFTRVAKNKPNYTQVRCINAQGYEIARVDNNDNVEITSINKLQYKGDRYYFKETKELKDGEIYISPLDLNMENGEVEIPHKPMLRVATPLFNEDSELECILIINYSADYFKELISKKHTHPDFDESELYILNKHGEFIVHPDESKSFSFCFDETEHLNFKDVEFELWNTIKKSGAEGHFSANNKVYSFYDLLKATKKNIPTYKQSWIIVHTITSSSLLSAKTILSELFSAYSLYIFLIIVAISFILAFVIERLRKRTSELETTRKIAESTNDSIIITDVNTNILYVNQSYENSTGYSKKEVIGLKPNRFKSGKHGADFYREMWESINDTGEWKGMLWDRRKDGLLYPKRLRILAVKDPRTNKVHNYIGVFSDLSTNKRKSDIFQSLKYGEGEVVIPNQEMMIDLLNQYSRFNKHSFIVVYIAIENYNQLINSLKKEDFEISTMFTNLIKVMLNDDDFIAQTGRNLFAVVVDEHSYDDESRDFVTRLHRKLGTVREVDEKNVFFKTRIGVSHWTPDIKNMKSLILNSMVALEWTSYRQETDIAFFEEKMAMELEQENEIEAHLRTAISNNELYIVYQPQIDIRTEKIVGMEALLRWECKELGNISPVTFIPIAEKNHLMIDIGDWIFDKVCSDIKYINDTCELDKRKLRCAINISPIQMDDPRFVDKIQEFIDRYKIHENELEIEITESLILNNMKKNIEKLNIIREMGVTVAIDDFGTGYSSLAYLKELPIDKIKIDRSFIKDYPEWDDGKLTNILVDMSKLLNKKVLTEGAETKKQIDYLKSIGCDYVQGFYYSKPLTLNSFIDFIANEESNFKNSND